MPVWPGAKGKTELDMRGLARILQPSELGTDIAMIEQVSAMPNQGSSSTFRFGQTFGAIQMAVMAHGYETHYVTPTNWKKHFGLSSDKGVSRKLASQRFPDADTLFARVKDDGRAEAALLALYAYEKVFWKKP
jgi:crossover junction endodeoxyribonuclease RuvC